ncbi:MAG: hypothetical protein ACREU6_12390, partial [Steroidobacteraceae bacterium]
MNPSDDASASKPETAHQHCGILTIDGSIPVHQAWRDISYSPVRDRIWTVSEGIYRSIFLEGTKG